MAIRWCERYYKDQDYYIHKATSAEYLLKISADIKGARAELDEMEQAIYTRFNEIQRDIKYPQVEITREQNQYSQDKKVKLNVRLVYLITLDGIEIKKEWEYSKSKQFTYPEKKAAIAYANELSRQYNHCKIITHMKGRV